MTKSLDVILSDRHNYCPLHRDLPAAIYLVLQMASNILDPSNGLNKHILTTNSSPNNNHQDIRSTMAIHCLYDCIIFNFICTRITQIDLHFHKLYKLAHSTQVAPNFFTGAALIKEEKYI